MSLFDFITNFQQVSQYQHEQYYKQKTQASITQEQYNALRQVQANSHSLFMYQSMFNQQLQKKPVYKCCVKRVYANGDKTIEFDFTTVTKSYDIANNCRKGLF